MFLVDEPYVSGFFKRTVWDHGIPVVGTPAALRLGLLEGTRILGEAEAVALAAGADPPPVYALSENSIGWIAENLAATGLPGKIELFKNKAKFRTLTRSLFPGLFFRELGAVELAATGPEEVSFPVVIKPAVGFFSMGVRKVSGAGEWAAAVGSILAEMERVRGLYPDEVLDTSTFVVEQVIEGEEFAVDAYFDAAGEPVVTSIFHHLFSSGDDVGDRVYTTSREIVGENLEAFTDFLVGIGGLAGVRRFPVHVELRRGADGTLLPIEVNPMRFGGWCTTADLTALAWGFDPYLLYWRQQRPDWTRALRGREGRLFSIVVLDNSTGLPAEEIAGFDYERLLRWFEEPLELRRVDWRRWPLFGFLFTEKSSGNRAELDRILHSDLRELVTPVHHRGTEGTER